MMRMMIRDQSFGLFMMLRMTGLYSRMGWNSYPSEQKMKLSRQTVIVMSGFDGFLLGLP